MKRLMTIALALVGALMLVLSCEKAPFVTMTGPRSFTFTRDGGTQPFTFTCNRDWSVSSSESWIRVSPSSGTKGDNEITVTITCSANTTYDPRNATITVRVEELTETISVTQETGIGLLVSPSTFDLTNAEQTIEVEVQQNVNYTVEIDEACKDWIKQGGTKALSTDKVTFTIAANASYDKREGKITFKQSNGDLTCTVTVQQAQLDAIITQSTYDISYEQQSLGIEVKSNVEFEVLSQVDWIKYVETKALSSSTITVSIDANESYDGRTGTIVIKQKNGNISETVSIKQKGLVKKDITLSSAGTLADALGSEASSTNYLIIHGPINGSDIRFIRALSSIFILDISNAVIKSGGESYYDTYYTTDDIIGAYMFYEMTYQELLLPKSVKKIDSQAFFDFNGIKVVLPEGIEELADQAFSRSNNLIEIKIPDSVTKIGEYCFSLCKSLKKAEYGAGLSGTGIGTFFNCHALSEVILPDNIVTIDESAFEMCYALQSVNFPSKLISIAQDSFRRCSGIKEIVIPDSVKRLEDNCFNCFQETSSLEKVTLGKNLEYLGNGSFYCSIVLKEIVIPSKVTYIGHDCFGTCNKLSNIKLEPINPPTASEYGYGYGRIHFYGLPSDAVMYVPQESLTKYKEAQYWRELASIMVGY